MAVGLKRKNVFGERTQSIRGVSWEKNRQTDRQTDWQTDRVKQTDRQTGRQSNSQADRSIDKKTDRMSVSLTEWPAVAIIFHTTAFNL